MVIEATAEFACALQATVSVLRGGGGCWLGRHSSRRLPGDSGVSLHTRSSSSMPSAVMSPIPLRHAQMHCIRALVGSRCGNDQSRIWAATLLPHSLHRPGAMAHLLCAERRIPVLPVSLQSLPMASQRSIRCFSAVAEQAPENGATAHHRNLGLVVGATWPNEVSAGSRNAVRRCQFSFLESVGKQGGDLGSIGKKRPSTDARW